MGKAGKSVTSSLLHKDISHSKSNSSKTDSVYTIPYNNAGYNFTLHFPRKLIAGCLLSNKVKVSSTNRNHIEGRPLLFSIQDKITRNRSEFFVQENGKPSMIWLSNSLYYRETTISTRYSRRKVESEKSEPQMRFESSTVSELI